MITRSSWWLLGALGLSIVSPACDSGEPAEPGPKPLKTDATLTLTPVAWNPSGTNVGQVKAVAENGGSFAVFGSSGVTMFTGGASAATDESVTDWRSAGVIPSADGTSTWIVGIGGDGHVRWMSGVASSLEDVTDRFGLLDAKVMDVASTADAKTPPIGFVLENGIAVSDGKNVVRYDDGGEHMLAAGNNGLLAIASPAANAIRVLDAKGHETDTSLLDASFVAWDARGELLAATHHALYKIAGAEPQLVFDAGPRTIHGLVSAGANVWMAIDAELALYQPEAASLAISAGQTFPSDVRLFGSPSGDVWTIAAGTLGRFSGKTSNDDAGTWTSSVQPIYASVCSNCHSPAGTGKDSAGIDLSTYESWASRRAKIRDRVVAKAGTPRAMPPLGSSYTITDEQRAAIGTWAGP